MKINSLQNSSKHVAYHYKIDDVKSRSN